MSTISKKKSTKKAEIDSDADIDADIDVEVEIDFSRKKTSNKKTDANFFQNKSANKKPVAKTKKALATATISDKKTKAKKRAKSSSSTSSEQEIVIKNTIKKKAPTKKELQKRELQKKELLKKQTQKKQTREESINDLKDKNRILEVKTSQTGAIKQVFERISNIISDCCIVFIPPDDAEYDSEDDNYYEEIDETNPKALSKMNKNKNKKMEDSDNDNEKKKRNMGGIRILRLTEDKSILIKLNLNADKFDSFKCLEPKLSIGVDMHNLHGLLKMISDDDPIVFYMNRDNRSTLFIQSLNENNEGCEETKIEMFLMEIENTEMPIPKTKFQNKITMASDKFHAICKHLNNNSVHVEIQSINDEISFRGQNDGGKATKSYKDVNYTGVKKPDQVVQGVYELRNLMSFSKCNKLCNTIEIYLKNEFPLVLVISVANLGKMYVFLTPIENDTN